MTDQLPRIPTMEEAEAEVLAEWEAEKQEALRFFANEKVKRVAEIHRQAEREERNQRQREAERAEAESMARKAWRKVLGRDLAGRLEPWTEYRIAPWGDKRIIIREENAETTLALAVEAGIATSGHQDAGVLGIRLTTIIRGRQEVAGIDPTPEQIAEIGRRRAEAEGRDRERRIAADARERRRQRQRDLVGVELD